MAENRMLPGQALAHHVDEVYEALRGIAAAYFRGQPSNHTLQATALVNEALLKILKEHAEKRRAPYREREHLIAVATGAMRQVLVDHARTRNAVKRGGGQARLAITDNDGVARAGAVDVLELHDALGHFAAIDERAARVIELRFFGGLSIQQTASVLGVSDWTVESDWRAGRAWLAARWAP